MNAGFRVLCRFAMSTLLAATALAATGCDDSVGGERGSGSGTGGGTGSGGGGDVIAPPQSIDALDLLLVVDGSGSMADKQSFLAASLRPFLERIRSPRCVDGAHEAVANQPAAQTDACPEGSVREYASDVTVHVGVVSSNLGTGGSSICAPIDQRHNDDQGHLVARDVASGGSALPTYEGLGFFAWDPGARLSPPGADDFDGFATQVETAIRGVGELGCGFEMPLEAMYRFLSEPAPTLDDGTTTDDALLAQRAAFLRPDSVLHVVLLSDENDASFRDDAVGRYGMSAPGSEPMPRPRAECAVDPNDACCVSCIDTIPDGCGGDGGCAAPGDPDEAGNYYAEDDVENDANLRAWDTKRRFGIDFLFPTTRYVEALSSPTLTQGDGTTTANPVFATAGGDRHVLFTAVVGVPWQDVARDPSDPALGFQSAQELIDRGTWSVILGDPASDVAPTDPHMIESPEPRPGLSTTPGSSALNGNEWDTGLRDLQYACVFDLPEDAVRVCEPDTSANCNDCNEEAVDKPVCAPNAPLTQIRAKAYPGLRQLEIVRALGTQASIVPLCGLIVRDDEDPPGPVGTFILQTGLAQAAEEVASLLGGAAE